jgi:hypothetical protein
MRRIQRHTAPDLKRECGQGLLPKDYFTFDPRIRYVPVFPADKRF